jgi:AraC-like DNA-binding protein
MMYTTAIFVAFFLALIILTKKGRTLADVFLGVWMIVIGIHLFAYYSFVSGIIFRYPDIMWFNLPYAFLHGPLLYLYTEALTNPENFRTKSWLLHFVLPVLIGFSDLPIMLLSENERIILYKNDWAGFETLTLVQGVLLSTSGIVYIVITNILLFKHKRRILGQFSNQEKINLNWLRFLFYGMGVLWTVIIFTGNDEWIFSMASVFIVFIGYFGIKQGGIFTNRFPEMTEEDPIREFVIENAVYDSGIVKKKYAKSGLNEDAAKDLHLQLQHVMYTGKLFTEPELTLTDLAGRLSVHPNYLSQVINESEGVNFYDYVNALRVEEFKRLVSIPENQKYTLLALAYDCGFNSKSAFNRFFKKSTSLSPSEYLKSIV